MNSPILADSTLSPALQVWLEVLKALAPILVLGLIAFLKKPLRNFFLYRRTEYDFTYFDNQGPTKWDIQWEGYRFTIKVAEVHNNYIEGVDVIEQDTPPEKHFDKLSVSDEFHSLFKGTIEFKLNTIIRTIPRNGAQTYVLRFVLRRRNK